jgi:hypothetical protein
MARKPRIEYKGAFYHVITRGNQYAINKSDPLDSHDMGCEIGCHILHHVACAAACALVPPPGNIACELACEFVVGTGDCLLACTIISHEACEDENKCGGASGGW